MIQKQIERVRAHAPYHEPLEGPEYDQGYSIGYHFAVEDLNQELEPAKELVEDMTNELRRIRKMFCAWGWVNTPDVRRLNDLIERTEA